MSKGKEIHINQYGVNRFDYIDSLRGIAILLVCLVHALVLSESLSYFAFGQRGVQLFYIVSALTLWMSWDYRKIERKPFLNFAVRRFFRIFPVFYLAIILNLVVVKIEKANDLVLIQAPHPSNFTSWEIFQGIFFIHGFQPHLINTIAIGGWSVAVEATFYLVLPLLFKMITNFRASFVLLAVSLATCPLLSYFLANKYPAHTEYFTFMWFPIQFPIFCMGIFLYFAIKKLNSQSNPTDRRVLSLFFIVFGTLTFLLIPTKNATLYFSSLALMFMVLGIAGHPIRIFNNGYLQFFGKISYSFYLLHFFTFIVLAKISNLWGLDFAASSDKSPVRSIFVLFIIWILAITLTAPIAFISYKRIEKPFILFGRRVIQKSEGGTKR